ncbi:hypothetical protein BC829DRAFT_395894 [Chytridium lagenaria]|nr:hypothetical protein BC829DRAFT_395894 [Chytridium lagenaria]
MASLHGTASVRRQYWATSWSSPKAPAILIYRIASDLSAELPNGSPYSNQAKDLAKECMEVIVGDPQNVKGEIADNLKNIVKTGANWLKKKTLSNAALAILELETTKVDMETLSASPSAERLTGTELAFLQLFNNGQREESKRKPELRNGVNDLLREIERCPCLKYREIRLCCDFIKAGNSSKSASSWLPEATKPIPGEVVGDYLKRLIQSIEGGLILKPLCDLLVNIFDEGNGHIRLSPEARPLVRAIIRASPVRHELLRDIASLGRHIIRENGVKPCQLAVVFAVHNLKVQMGTLDQNSLDDVRQRALWNAVWGVIMNNFEFLDA